MIISLVIDDAEDARESRPGGNPYAE